MLFAAHRHVQRDIVDRFRVALPTIAALLDRPDSLPGRKDRYEILRLLDDPAASHIVA